MVTTTYPADPSTSLTLTWNESSSTGGTDSQDSIGGGGSVGGPGLWELVWVDDPSSVTWVAVPSAGLAYPGDSITVSCVVVTAAHFDVFVFASLCVLLLFWQAEELDAAAALDGEKCIARAGEFLFAVGLAGGVRAEQQAAFFCLVCSGEHTIIVI